MRKVKYLFIGLYIFVQTLIYINLNFQHLKKKKCADFCLMLQLNFMWQL